MKLRLSPIHKNNEVVFNNNKRVVFHLQKKLGRLLFTQQIGCLPFDKKIEVVFHISSGWVKIRLHAKNQLPRLLITALIVNSPSVVVAVVSWFILTANNTTPKVVGWGLAIYYVPVAV